MHQVVEDAGEIKLGGISLGALGYLTEWKMLIGYCFEHGGFRVADSVSPYDESTWESVACPECKRTRKKIADREWMLLGGTLDGLEPLWRDFDPEEGILYCVLWDLKTMQEYAVRYFIKGDDKNQYHRHVKDEHFAQAQVYKYLAERSKVPEVLAEKGVKQIKLVESNIQAFSMGEFPRTGSKYMWKEHYTHDDSLWDIPSVHFMEDEWIENHITSNGYQIYKSLILKEERATICPPEGNKKGEHSWRCRFCAFYGSAECPNPTLEWELLQSGMAAEEAFKQALKSQTAVI